MKRFLILLTVFSFLLFSPVLSANSFCIDINTAPEEELTKIRHIGQSRANQIIELRQEKLFFSIDDLIRVSGIGAARITDIKEEGLACVQSQTNPKPEVQPQKQPKNISQQPKQTEQPELKITLAYPKDNPINKEIKVVLFVSNLKEADYDVKISIEREKTISNTYNKNEDKWRSSQYYLNSLFFGSSFEQTFHLKIREENFNFEGQADLLVRIRESGQSAFLEHVEKININKPELPEDKISENKNSNPTKGLAAIEKQFPGFFNLNRPLFTALTLAVFFAIIILILKKRIKPRQ